MSTRMVAPIVLVSMLVTALPLLAAEEPTPEELRRNRNNVAFNSRAEGAVVSSLRDAAPLAEGYFQRYVAAGTRGSVVNGDHYLLGRFTWRTHPTLDDLLAERARSQEDDPTQTETQVILDALAYAMVPDWELLSPDRYEFTFVKRAPL